MSFEINAGRPFVVHKEAGDSTAVQFPSTTLSLMVNGAQGTKIYFTQADLDADTGYLTIGASGSFQASAAVKFLYIAGTGPVEVVGFCITR